MTHTLNFLQRNWISPQPDNQVSSCFGTTFVCLLRVCLKALFDFLPVKTEDGKQAPLFSFLGLLSFVALQSKIERVHLRASKYQSPEMGFVSINIYQSIKWCWYWKWTTARLQCISWLCLVSLMRFFENASKQDSAGEKAEIKFDPTEQKVKNLKQAFLPRPGGSRVGSFGLESFTLLQHSHPQCLSQQTMDKGQKNL